MPFESEYFTLSAYQSLPKGYGWLILRSTQGGGTSFRNHRSYHIRYIIAGSVKYTFDDKEIIVHEGQGVIMPPHVPYTVYSENGYQKLDTVISALEPKTILYKKTCEISNGNIVVTRPLPLNLNYNELRHHITVPSDFNIRLMQNKLEVMALSILEELSRLRKSVFEEQIEELITSGKEAFPLAELCEITGYSQAHFERLMVKHFGCSAIEYFNRIRTNKICNLLENTNLSLTEIAEAANFYDTSHLNTFFKKRMGTTPGKYRKRRIE